MLCIKNFKKSSYEPDSEMVEGYDKPDEKLKTDRDMFNVPKDEQSAARKRILARHYERERKRVLRKQPILQTLSILMVLREICRQEKDW